MKFIQKYRNGMVVEWEDQYVNFAYLKNKLCEIELLKKDLENMQNVVEDIVVEMTSEDESQHSTENETSQEISPNDETNRVEEEDDEEDENVESEYTQLALRIQKEEEEFWKEIDMNLEKIDVFYCTRLRESCRFINDFYDRLKDFGLVDESIHNKEKFQPIRSSITEHEKIGIIKMCLYEQKEMESLKKQQEDNQLSFQLAASMFQETEEVIGACEAFDMQEKSIQGMRKRYSQSASIQVSRLDENIDEDLEEYLQYNDIPQTTSPMNKSPIPQIHRSTESSKSSKTISRSVSATLSLGKGGEVNPHEDETEVEIDDVEGEKEIEKISEISRRKKNKLKIAAEEFYRGLLLMQNYCSMNIEALIKLVKKYDKITKLNKLETFKTTHLQSTLFYKMEALKILIQETELLFQDAFHDENRLKQFQSKGTHLSIERIWRIGCLVGAFVYILFLLICKIVSYISTINTLDDETLHDMSIRKLTENELISILYISRAFILVILIQIFWGIDMYIYTQVRINYVFIFDMHQRKYNYMHSIESGLFLLVVTLTCFYGLLACIYPQNGFQFLQNIPYWVILLIVVVFQAVIFIYKQIKHPYVFNIVLRIITAPFRKVYFKDFWMADQFTSLSPIFSDMIYCIIYFIYGWICYSSEDFKGDQMIEIMKYINPVVSCFPPLFRFLQCFRSAHDSGNKYQYANAGKYFTSIIYIIANGIKTVYKKVTIPIYIIVGIINSCYSGTWDIVMDWGLLRRKYYLLRKKILYPIWTYPIFILIDIILRFIWIVNLVIIFVPWFDTHKLVKESISYVLNIIEVMRRGMWNVFRVEFEMTNNMDKFRATKEIPLPLPD